MSAASNFRLESDDDIVILQYGTNDRHTCVSSEHTQYCLSNTINKVLEYGHIPIVMCANPCTHEWEYNVPRRFHMWDVRNAIELTAKKYEIPFVDNYIIAGRLSRCSCGKPSCVLGHIQGETVSLRLRNFCQSAICDCYL